MDIEKPSQRPAALRLWRGMDNRPFERDDTHLSQAVRERIK